MINSSSDSPSARAGKGCRSRRHEALVDLVAAELGAAEPQGFRWDATGPLAARLESSGEQPMTLLKFCSNVQCISVMRLLMRCHTYTTVALLWCDAVSSLQ